MASAGTREKAESAILFGGDMLGQRSILDFVVLFLLFLLDILFYNCKICIFGFELFLYFGLIY